MSGSSAVVGCVAGHAMCNNDICFSKAACNFLEF